MASGVFLEKLIWAPQKLNVAYDAAFSAAVKETAAATKAAAPRSENPSRGASSKRQHMADGIKGSVTIPGKVGMVYMPGPALFVIKGTRPHKIEAKRAGALHFFWNGSEVFAASVNHPGTRANPFHEGPLHAFPGLFNATARRMLAGIK